MTFRMVGKRSKHRLCGSSTLVGRFLVAASCPTTSPSNRAKQGLHGAIQLGSMSNISDNLAVAMAKTFRTKNKVRACPGNHHPPRTTCLCVKDPPHGGWGRLRCSATQQPETSSASDPQRMRRGRIRSAGREPRRRCIRWSPDVQPLLNSHRVALCAPERSASHPNVITASDAGRRRSTSRSSRAACHPPPAPAVPRRLHILAGLPVTSGMMSLTGGAPISGRGHRHHQINHRQIPCRAQGEPLAHKPLKAPSKRPTPAEGYRLQCARVAVRSVHDVRPELDSLKHSTMCGCCLVTGEARTHAKDGGARWQSGPICAQGHRQARGSSARREDLAGAPRAMTHVVRRDRLRIELVTLLVATHMVDGVAVMLTCKYYVCCFRLWCRLSWMRKEACFLRRSPNFNLIKVLTIRYACLARRSR